MRYRLHYGDSPVQHKGLKKFFIFGLTAAIQHRHAGRLRLILGRLSAAGGTSRHEAAWAGIAPVEGDRRGSWAVQVSGNWRVTFRFQDSDVTDVGYEGYY
ncbi:MAG: type II toxin-antitoxin system RelE/ParE family toxin [Gemmatimonadaceae bacterium]